MNDGAYTEIFFDKNTHLIEGMGEKKTTGFFFAGAAVLEPSWIWKCLGSSVRPSEFTPSLLQPAVEQQKGGVFSTNALWYDVGEAHLWQKTHFDLIRRLEIGSFPCQLSRLWRENIESENKRIGELCWASRATPWNSLVRHSSAPAYLSWEERQDNLCQSLRRMMRLPAVSVGPRGVYYGKEPLEWRRPRCLENGIGYGKFWQSIKES